MKRKRVVGILAGFLAVLLALAGMMEYRARVERGLALEALERRDSDGALRHYSRALNWYVPFGTAETAAEELLEMGLKWDKEGRDNEAVLALSRMRSGLYGARSLYTPRRDLISRAEPVLARLRAKAKLGAQAPASDLVRQARIYLDLMQRPARPALGPALAAAGGFLIWVISALVFIARFFSGNGGGSWPRAWPWAAVWAAGFSLWLWGMKWA